LALVCLLVLLVALGVHGHFATPAWRARSQAWGTVAVVVEAVAMGLIVVLWARSRGAPPGRRVAATLRKALLYVLVTGALLLAAAIAAGRALVPNSQSPTAAGKPEMPACSSCSHRARPLTAPGSLHFPVSDVLYGLAAALLLAAIVAVSMWLMSQGRQHLPPEPEAPAAPAEEYDETLQDALEGGRRALLGVDEARAAIIACYVAMETILARAGTTRSIAETPDDLLARAASRLPMSGEAARRLTSLFYEARFSSHPLDGNSRAAAEDALAELALELGRARPAPAQAASGP
jgi:hypothetical protein